MSLMNYAHTNKCPSCSGCDVDGCEAQCHGAEFGVHPERDEVLANLLAEEDALKAAKANEVPDITLLGRQRWAEVSKCHGKVLDGMEERFMSFYQPGYREKYASDVAYWQFNYAPSQVTARKREAEIEAMRLEIAKLKVQVLEDQLWHAKEAVLWIEDPYRYG